MGHVRYQIIGFLVFWFHSETFFNSRWYWRSWPPDMNDLWRSKYEINENKSFEVSNDSFFWGSDSILRPLFDLRWSWRWWPPDINDLWRSKYEINENSHARYQIIGFLVFRLQSETPFWTQMITEVVTSRY